MLNYTIKEDDGHKYIETDLHGRALLFCAQLNKGTAFTQRERHDFNLIGKLPSQVESMEEQVHRAYFQFKTQSTRLRKNMYLHELHESNRVLFYRLVGEYASEMLPILYTPLVSTIVKIYSQKFRSPRGLYITYDDRDNIAEILNNRSNPNVEIAVITDGEGVLGIGDQGIGGMEIAVAKLMVYTLFADIDPLTTLPIFLDVGTNNKALLNDPMYLGWRHPRISPEQYDEFIDKFINAMQKTFPHVFLHWEDLGRQNAARILKKYRHESASFNDDIQGTAVVTLAALLTAINRKNSTLAEETIVIYGGGTAGTGIAEHIARIMIKKFGISEKQAYDKLWIIDRNGLIFDDMDDITPEQAPFAKSRHLIKPQSSGFIDLASTIDLAKPTILIGCSGQGGAFHEKIVRKMCLHTDQPIIFPLSNPTANAEAHPQDLLAWTDGKAMIATGSPFASVTRNDKKIVITQCNNALIFPAIGLAMATTKASRLSFNMLYAGCEALSAAAILCIKEQGCPLLPAIAHSKQHTLDIAFAIAKAAGDEGLYEKVDDDTLKQRLKEKQWKAEYLPLKRIKSGQ